MSSERKDVNGMTLQDIERIPKEYLTAAQVAPVLGSDPQTIRMQARLRPDLLPFPVVCLGSRVKIPKEAFLRVMRGLELRLTQRGERDNGPKMPEFVPEGKAEYRNDAGACSGAAGAVG